MSPTICILCGNAAFNRGDRANLTAQIDLLRRFIPEATIVIGSDRPEVDREWYNADRIVRRGTICSWKLLQEIRNADLIIWGGGALLADNAGRLLIPYWFFLISFIRGVLRKPVFAWAHGLVIETRLGALLARLALKCADEVTVRDRGSLQTLKRIGSYRDSHTQTADAVICLKPDDPSVGRMLLSQATIPHNRPLIAITPTFWQYYHRSTDILPYAFARKLGLRRHRGKKQIHALSNTLIKVADRLIERLDAHILILPRYPAPPWRDVEFLEQSIEESRHQESITLWTRDDVPPKSYFAMWPHFSCVLSVALHDAIVAAAMDVPAVQLSYESKGTDFAIAMESTDRLLPLETLFEKDGIERVASTVERAIAEWPNQMEIHKKHRLHMQHLAEENGIRVATFLDRLRGTARL